MRLIDTIRVLVLLTATVLFVSGIGPAIHPKYKAVAGDPHRPPQVVDGFVVSEVTTSTSSRVFGIIRVLIAVTLAAWVGSTFYPRKIRLSLDQGRTCNKTPKGEINAG
jgi:hypothetical protein